MSELMDIIYGIFIFIITTCIGSFLNVVIYRLPNKMSLAKPSSHCPNCNYTLKWYDNIPIISYIFLKGKCRNCKKKISPRYIIVELLTGVICTLIYYRFGLSINCLFGILLFLCLVPISFIDIEHFIIPDIFILILFILGVIGLFIYDLNYCIGDMIINYKSKLISLAIVIVFWFIIFLFEKLLKKDLMGGGDIKLIGVSGLILGWQLLLLVVGFSSIIACISELILKSIRNKINYKKEFNLKYDDCDIQITDKSEDFFPFGPYLSISIIVVYLFGINIIEWWMSLLIL